MLKQLFIQNYSLIESLDISFEQGLTAITGETGAGKSIILGAISLLLGQRADSKSLFDTSKKCIIEGSFEVSNHLNLPQIFEKLGLDFEATCTIRREINPAGKSRSFVNDTPVNLDALKEIGIELVDIHSQQDTWWMSEPEFLINMVDSYAQHTMLLEQYTQHYAHYLEKKQQVATLKKSIEEGNQQVDYLQFQLDELVSAQLKEHELPELETLAHKLSNAEQIHEKLVALAHYISVSEESSLQQIKTALSHAQSLSKWSDEYSSWKNRIESIWIELKDLGLEIENEAEDFQSDPVTLENAQNRLDLLHRLLKKHRKDSVKELIEWQEDLAQQVNLFNNSDKALQEAASELEKALEELNNIASELSNKRRACFDSISKELVQTMQLLGMENVQFAWEFEEKSFSNNGKDRIQLLFSANKGSSLKPFKQIASGGELSRLMLAIKALLAHKKNMPTLILDEIDAGVSGDIGFKIAEILKAMGHHHQIIAITHLHQIASAGQKHYFVFKDHQGEKTISKIKELTSDDRIDEIAKMIGGNDGYESLRENVKKLLQAAS